MGKKLRAGTFTTEIEEEQVLWHDRKRWLFLGLPWTFTRYDLTESKLRVSVGFFKKTEDDILLYRISDVTFFQTLGERLNGLGTLCIISSDVSQPEAHLRHVKKPHKVKTLLMQKIEEARKKNGVFASELVGSGMGVRPRPPINKPDQPGDQPVHEQPNPKHEKEKKEQEHMH